MGHHGNEAFFNQEPFDEEFMKKFTKQKSGDMTDLLGSTGAYPNGKMNTNDEGELVIGVTKSQGNVVVDFGKKVHWIGFSPAQAIGLGELLIKRAKEIVKDQQ